MCGMHDSWRHSLIECTMASCVWALVDPPLLERLIATTKPLARNWLFAMMEVLSHDELTRLTVTLWAIWTSRRKLIHEGIHQSPLSTHLFIIGFITELDQVNTPPLSHVAAAPMESSRRRRPPPVGHVKFTVDAGVSLDHNTGAVAAYAKI